MPSARFRLALASPAGPAMFRARQTAVAVVSPEAFPGFAWDLHPAADAARLAKPILVVFIFLLPFSSTAQAHDLEVRAHVLPFWRIQVESWFDSGDVARQAKVEVFQGQRLIANGRLNRQGVWGFTYQEVEPLRIVVNAGAGHRREVTVSGEELRRQVVSTAALCLTPPPSLLAAPLLTPHVGGSVEEEAVTISDRETGPPLGGLVVGVVLLLLVAAVAMGRRKSGQQSRLN